MTAAEFAGIRACLFPEEKIYGKGDIIMHAEKKGKEIAILESGTAQMIRIDIDGQKSIIDYYEAGDIFGTGFSPISNYDTLYILAKEKCRISFIDYDKFISKCSRNCDKHSRFLENMVLSAFRKAQLHVDILSKRTIRAKLLTYFEYLRQQKNADRFTLPLTISDMADYIAADRSSMSREIKKMNEEGIIESSGNVIRLKKSEYGE